MASLKDIAKSANVSVRTVGRVVRANGYVSGDVRARVMAVAERLGYRPHLAARALRTGQSMEVAMLVGEMNELVMARLEAVERCLRADGYAVFVLFARATGEEPAHTEHLVERVLLRRPAGVAFIGGLPLDLVRLTRALERAGIPSMGVDPRLRGVDGIWIGREEGVALAVHHLAQAGRQHVAYLGPADDPSRLDGYRLAMRELGRAPIVVTDTDVTAAAVDRLLGQVPRPDAVQTYSDRWAMMLLRELAHRGVAVPADMAVVGFDDRELTAFARPALTTLAQPSAEVGESAAAALLAKIAGQPAPPGGWSRRIPMKLVVRESA